MVEGGGMTFLMIWVVVVMEVRLSVLSIMLAKPMMMAMMIPIDTIPPVSVL